MTLTTGFTGSPLNRADHLRDDPEAVATLMRQPEALLLRLEGLDPQLNGQGGLGWGPIAEAGDHSLALLGFCENNRPRFVALDPVARGASAMELWATLEALPAGEAAIYAAARSLVGWHARHRFCAVCGTATNPFRAGWGRNCLNCSAEHFPRTDPVVIMIADYQGKALVGRQPRFPPNRYSALAGFLEIGESIEEAVAREIKEEAGIEVGNVRYVASQPWPFPSSLMIACIAEARTDQIQLDDKELEDAMWITRDEAIAALDAAPDARFQAPPPLAIARTLLQAWVGGA